MTNWGGDLGVVAASGLLDGVSISIWGDIIPSRVLLRVRAWVLEGDGVSSSFKIGPGVKREFEDADLGPVRVGTDMSRSRDLREG